MLDLDGRFLGFISLFLMRFILNGGHESLSVMPNAQL